jgi:hypothetical protein
LEGALQNTKRKKRFVKIGSIHWLYLDEEGFGLDIIITAEE